LKTAKKPDLCGGQYKSTAGAGLTAGNRLLFSPYPAPHRDDGILATWLRQKHLPQGSAILAVSFWLLAFGFSMKRELIANSQKLTAK
jgi:hypothetical protein